MAWKVQTQAAPWDWSMSLVVSAAGFGGNPSTPSAAEPLVFHALKQGEAVPEGLIWKMARDDATAMLAAFAEAAWRNGWRPEGHAVADTTAQKEHLEDMRRLVFKEPPK